MSHRESETVKNIGEKTSSGLKRAGTAIKDTGAAAGTKISSAAQAFKVCFPQLQICSDIYEYLRCLILLHYKSWW